MAQKPPRRHALVFLPDRLTLPALRQAARSCRGCGLYARATQTVFGEGRRGAAIVVVGEQPGDREDVEGRPFVGPAGSLLDAALGEAGLDRDEVYVTNAVKHFKWTPRGKRRMHQRPTHAEVTACRPWLEAELATVNPRVVVCLGATAAQALFGSSFRITTSLGRAIAGPQNRTFVVSYHPAAILRMPTHEARDKGRRELVSALKLAKTLHDGPSRDGRSRRAVE